jgi:hypothetical protein
MLLAAWTRPLTLLPRLEKVVGKLAFATLHRSEVDAFRLADDSLVLGIG